MDAKKSRFSLLPLQAAAPPLPPGLSLAPGPADPSGPGDPPGFCDSPDGSIDGWVEAVPGASDRPGDAEDSGDVVGDPGGPVAVVLPQARDQQDGQEERRPGGTGADRGGSGVERSRIGASRVGIVAWDPARLRPERARVNRTIDGSTPKTSRIRSADRTSPRAAVGHDPAAVEQHEPREEGGGEAEVVEDGQDRRPVADVEIDQQLHGRDLVAQVEVDRRLVEDQDRRGLGDGQRDERELALAEGQLADVPSDAGGRSRPARWRTRPPRDPPGGRRAADPRAAGGRDRPAPRPWSRTAR